LLREFAFYFMANTKSEQWIGVADSEPPNPEAQNDRIRVADISEPAPPGTNEEDVDLTKTEPDSDISGEMTIGMAIADTNLSGPRRVDAKVDADPAVLGAIGKTLWTTLRPIYDPLLTTIDSPKLDVLGQLLIGNQNPIAEIKLPDPSGRPPQEKIAEDWQRPSSEGRLQDLIIQTQTIRNATSWNNMNVPRGALQTVNSPTEPGSNGASLRGGNPLGKQPLSAPLPLGH
jgi:hypothetical protein